MDILLLQLGSTLQGEITLGGYAGQIEVLSFSHGISQSIVRGLIGRTGTVGPKHEDMTLTKYLDFASTGLLDTCNRGAVLPQAILTAAHVEGEAVQPFWTVTLNNVIVTSISASGGGGGRPTETLTLNYTSISWLYQSQTGTSGAPVTNSASWDLTTHAEIK